MGVCLLSLLCVWPACSKKEEGCKLDAECPEGQICRNMKCEGSADVNNAKEDQNPDAAKPADAAKPTTTQMISADAFSENKTVKLEDLGLDVDYILNDSIGIMEGNKLEIGAGVTIDMQSSSAGFNIHDDAALIVRGTAEAPVVFKSTNSSAWSGINFHSKNKDNSLNYLQIFNADGEERVIGLHGEARVAMDHVTLDGSANDGIWVSGDAQMTKFTNNTIRNCKGYPLVFDSIRSVNTVGDGNTYENNKPYIRINNGYMDNVKETSIKKLPLPYYMAEGMQFSGESGTLTIEAGVTFAFEHEREARIDDSIQLKIEGTADNPVVMRGMTDEPHFWRGLNIDTTRPSSISGLSLANTGNDEANSLRIRDDANIALSNITFKATDYRCLEIGGGAKIENKGGLTFEKCGKGNIFDYRIEGDDDKRVLSELPVAQ